MRDTHSDLAVIFALCCQIPDLPEGKVGELRAALAELIKKDASFIGIEIAECDCPLDQGKRCLRVSIGWSPGNPISRDPMTEACRGLASESILALVTRCLPQATAPPDSCSFSPLAAE